LSGLVVAIRESMGCGNHVMVTEGVAWAVEHCFRALTELPRDVEIGVGRESCVADEFLRNRAVEGALHASEYHPYSIYCHRFASLIIYTPTIDAAHEVADSHRIADIWRVTKGPKKRDVRITLRMPEDLATLVQEAADADRRSKSDWIVLQLEAIFTKRAGRKPEK
jgi:hypothetical protein